MCGVLMARVSRAERLLKPFVSVFLRVSFGMEELLASRIRVAVESAVVGREGLAEENLDARASTIVVCVRVCCLWAERTRAFRNAGSLVGLWFKCHSNQCPGRDQKKWIGGMRSGIRGLSCLVLLHCAH